MIGQPISSCVPRSFGPLPARCKIASRARRIIGHGTMLVLFCIAMISAPEKAQAQDGPSKVVVLGFDGADAAMVRNWMDEGKLPNLDRLRKQGTFSDLIPTNPPQTPSPSQP